MDVRVVTVTARPENLWFGEMLASVAEGLPKGVQHIIVHSEGGAGAWNRDLWAACQGADAVAVVDDDDRVLPGAIEACLTALRATRAGLAFTDEEEIDEAGQRVRDGLRRRRTLMDLAMHPRCVHHLAMFRPAYTPPEALALADRCGRGLDWLLRAAAGLRGGAVRVPMLGYQWRRHAAQDSASDGGVYARALPVLRQMTRSWMRYDAAIPEAGP
ncbi:MAG: hypothetical protein JSR30_13125 [Proteobacteria bacterium]|jgi:hypothetical protein|nr:hypothetical protein [Pseudomonadota bacterium]